MKKKILKNILAVAVAFALIAANAAPHITITVHADSFEKTADNTSIGSGALPYPNSSTAWNHEGIYGGGWGYVYFGKYNGNPVKYRVLDKNSTIDYGVQNGSMLLDCDNVLKTMAYNTRTDMARSERNRWVNSDVRSFLNGDSFLGNDECFTDAERDAIASSYKASKGRYDGRGWVALTFQPLTGEKIFVLDNAEAHNTHYGYIGHNTSDKNVPSPNRLKKNLSGREIAWWTRTYYDKPKQDDSPPDYYATMIGGDCADDGEGSENTFQGCIVGNFPSRSDGFGSPVGVSPALNLDLSRVLFTTQVEEEEDLYKLTLKDSSLSASVTPGRQITRSGDTITIPYTVTGDPNTISILITDNGGGTIRYYSAIKSGGIGSSGTASFTLPEGLANDDKVKLIAEQVNGIHAPDFASDPVEISIPTPEITFDANGGTVEGGTSTTLQTGLNGRLLSTPTPEHESLSFVGWFTAREGGEQITRTMVFDSPQTVYAHWTEMYYVDVDGTVKEISNAIELSGDSANDDMAGNWYYVTGNTETVILNVNGDAKLILCDDSKLTVTQGISIGSYGSLTIYCQSKGNGTVDAGSANSAYGISGVADCISGDLIINGGIINATAGSNDDAIGELKNIVINGGTVTAKGGANAAGIGGEEGTSSPGDHVVINGGTVTAKGGANAAGIGGGKNGFGVNVEINGGTVKATGGTNGAGIGGGLNGSGGSTTINGGTVTAKGGTNGAGIGAGYFNIEDTEDNRCGTVVIRGGKIKATAGTDAKFGIGPGNSIGHDNDRSDLTLGLTRADDYINAGKIYAKIILEAPHHFVDGDIDKGAIYGRYQSALYSLLQNNTYTIVAGKSSVGVSIADGDRSAVFGDDDFTLTGEITTPGSDGVWTWSSSDPNVASVDPSTGLVHIESAGETEISAAYVSDIVDGNAVITLTVDKAAEKALPDIACTHDMDFDIFEIDLDGKIPYDVGAISSFELDTSAISTTGSVTVSDASVDGYGYVMATLSGGAAGDTITIPVNVTAQNYDCTVNVVATLRDTSGDPPVDTSGFGAEGKGTRANPWKIESSERWDLFAAAVNGGIETGGRYFVLTGDIATTEMVGTNSNPFSGNLDGGGHTLTINASSSEQFCAPFRYASEASFSNLITTGKIVTSAGFASGLVGRAYVSCSIKNCVSDVDIEDTGGGQTDCGFAASCKNVDIEGCVFTGSITGENSKFCAGFLGWDDGNASTVRNCIYAGEMDTLSDSATFVRTTDSAENSFYMKPIGQGRDKGRQAFKVSAGDGVVIGFGDSTSSYSVSGIAAYAAGLEYNGTFYAGEGNTIALALSAPNQEEPFKYTVNAGSLTEDGKGWLLTMPAKDVTVTAVSTASDDPSADKDKAQKEYNDKVAAAKVLKGNLVKVRNLKGRKAQATWKKPSGKIKNTGFQIQYSTKKNFKKGTKSKFIKKASAKKAVIKKLKKKKTYYFRIRPYTDVKNPATGKNTRVYGKWSKAKKVRIKK